MAIWNILRTFGIFYDHLVHFVFIWYIFSGFGIMHQERSGNPVIASRGLEQFSWEPSFIHRTLCLNLFHCLAACGQRQKKWQLSGELA
jgi:hypothetical protein